MMSGSRTVRCISLVVLSAALLAAAPDARADLIGGIEFPQGAASFADAVFDYDPLFGGGSSPSLPNREPSNALGIPEVPGSTSVRACTGAPADCPFVSLGSGGLLILEFTDNVLIGSDSDALDLWVFEVGPDIEATFVAISSDGSTWNDVGRLGGTTGGVDIDAYGFGSSDRFRFVGLRDDPSEGGSGGNTPGADIDAVGAISTATVPEPATLGMLLAGLTALGAWRRRAAR
jgi:hypothetical protein